MDTSFPLSQTRCYQQAARLMAKGASLSVALRGCMGANGSRPSTASKPGGDRSSAEAAGDSR